jgi:formylmethanofuran dehydrogenase subunit E
MGEAEMPGNRGQRLACAQCGEGVNFGRVVKVNGETLCMPCAIPGQRYWELAEPPE